MIRNGISEFFIKNIYKYYGCFDYPLFFTGSLAFHFRKILRIVAKEKGIKIGKILQNPIEGLVEFHKVLI
jgi:hypothetical protein